MSKLTKKFLLVSLDDVEDQKNMARKIRRYLNANKLKYLFSADPEEMKEYMDKIFYKNANFGDIATEQLVFDDLFGSSMVGSASNQEILERWARSDFLEGSSEMQLLVGPEPEEALHPEDDEDSNGGSSPRDCEMLDKESERKTDNTAAPAPSDSHFAKLLPTNSIDSEALDGRKEDDVVLQECLLCYIKIDVGRNRNTKIKRQAQHIMDCHQSAKFRNLEISKRYECQRCRKVLPVQKSPCEHITDHHIKEEEETEFTDLWNKDQLDGFNFVLERCFARQLPVPRSRRLRCAENSSWVVPWKAPYRIKQGDGVVHIETLAEKDKRSAVIETAHINKHVIDGTGIDEHKYEEDSDHCYREMEEFDQNDDEI
uniref:C2H2-type domain-containing protein n=1 Tax=Caenorhabditis japonica TaxID=281687 RepID=A0A8R1HX97_CAEJA